MALPQAMASIAGTTTAASEPLSLLKTHFGPRKLDRNIHTQANHPPSPCLPFFTTHALGFASLQLRIAILSPRKTTLRQVHGSNSYRISYAELAFSERQRLTLAGRSRRIGDCHSFDR